MNTADGRTRWQNAFIYALVTTIMVLGAASIMGRAGRELAIRVDRNAAVAVTAADSIICILRIQPAERTDATIHRCLQENGYLDIPTVSKDETP